jgi:hypothetical protein
MSTIPMFNFSVGLVDDRDAARSFVELLASTGRFSRTARGQILFKVAEGDYAPISNKSAFCAILSDGDAIWIKPDSDELDELGEIHDIGAIAGRWLWESLIEYAWRLPRTGGKPYAVQS